MSIRGSVKGEANIRDERDRSTHSLLRKAANAPDPVTRQGLLERAVLLNRPMAAGVARQYLQRGIDAEDLLQVAFLGLVKAVRGYRPGVQDVFAAYAVPTIRGEVKRYFRDRGWMIRPPRGLQELNQAVRAVEPGLAQSLQRTPTTQDVARHLGVEAEVVRDARQAGRGYQALSLDCPTGTSGQRPMDVVDSQDQFEIVDALQDLRPALDVLGGREMCILRLRFVDNLNQEQIGKRIGVSQMQVSRLLSRILTKLREHMQDQRAA